MSDLFKVIDIPIAPILNRDSKGHITKGVAQDTNINGTAGRPCGFCQNKEEILKKTKVYLEKCKIGENNKPMIPYLEELALIIGVSDGTLWNWYEKRIGETGELEHPEFFDFISIVKTTQKFRLKQRALGRYNAHGALYLLNADHKVIQTTKELLGNADDKDLRITIVEEEK